jgi:multiple sugar transport system substrate-binding protein
MTAVAGGTPPDAVAHPNGQYLDYYARGVLLPLDELVAASNIIKKEDFLEGSWNNGFYQGVQYGVPANEGFLRYGLNYNTKLVEEAGLDPDNPPQTWSECLEWHKKLTQFDDAGNLVRIGLDPYDAMGGSLQFDNGFYASLSWGWNWFDEEKGTFDLNNEKMAEAFEVMGEFYKIAGPDNMAGMRQVEGQGTWGGSFNTEVQAMIIEGYWHPGETTFEKPEVAEFNRASWAPVPDSRKGTKVQGYGGHYILLFKEAPHATEAFKIAEVLNTTPACDLIFNVVGWLPALKPYLASVDPKKYNGLDFYMSSINEATAWHTPARCPITGFVQTQYTELRESVYREQMSGAEAAAEWQRRCEEEWKAAGFGS